MPRLLTILTLIGVVALIFLGMWRAWRAKLSRSVTLLPDPPPLDLGIKLVEGDTLYVSTTLAGQPLERLAIAGLAYRAKARITVATNGVMIAPRGEHPVVVPATSISSIRAATWTIDRVVERDGLVAITWTTRDVAVETYLRIVDTNFCAQFTEAIRTLLFRANTPLATFTK